MLLSLFFTYCTYILYLMTHWPKMKKQLFARCYKNILVAFFVHLCSSSVFASKIRFLYIPVLPYLVAFLPLSQFFVSFKTTSLVFFNHTFLYSNLFQWLMLLTFLDPFHVIQLTFCFCLLRTRPTIESLVLYSPCRYIREPQ